MKNITNDSRHQNRLKIAVSLYFLSVAMIISESYATDNKHLPVQPESTPVEIKIITTEFRYNPTTLKIKAGQPILLTLDNSQGTIEHNLVIKDLGIKITAKTGEIVKQRLLFDKPGEYNFKCSLPAHYEAGMAGKLTVEPAVATVAAEEEEELQDEKILELPAGIKHLPSPKAAPPVNRNQPALVKVDLEAVPMTALIAPEVGYDYWTFNGTVPGPMIRVRQGDTVELTLKNSLQSIITHSIDSHGITGPGGGAKFTQTAVGDKSILRFKAIKPGAYVYHCATPMVAHHISSGMYGLMVVEPEAGWPKVDHEFYVMQGDMYLQGKADQPGVHQVSIQKMNNEHPDYVIFNGSVGSLAKENALKAKVGETVRIFFGVGGPNVTSSFHVIGEMFDKVYTGGDPSDFISNVQTTMVPAGGSAIVDFKLDVPGSYILVDHSLSRLQKGAAGFIDVEGADNPEIFQPILFNKGKDSSH